MVDTDAPSAATTDPSVVKIVNCAGLSIYGNMKTSSADRFTVALNCSALVGDRAIIVGDLISVSVPATGADIEAEVTSTTMFGNVEVFHFRVERQLSGPPLDDQKERRATSRFTFRGRLPATVTSRTEPPGESVMIERSAAGDLADVSVGGCGLKLHRAEHRKLGSMSSALIRLKLPGSTAELELIADRVNSRLVGDDIILIGFRWTEDASNAAGVSAIENHVADMQAKAN